MLKEELKKYFKENGVIFASNSNYKPEVNWSCLNKSYSLYKDILDENFRFLDGSNLFYGYKAFIRLLNICFKNPEIKYAIYIDEDCFITDLNLLKEVFEDFKNSDAAFAGIPDGGIICHRNHNNLCINTFLTFFNIEKIRAGFDYNGFLEESKMILPEIMRYIDNFTFNDFRNKTSYNHLENIVSLFNECYKESIFVRKDEVPYVEVVKNDPSNPVEPNQVPYSSTHDDFEPYYRLFLFMMSIGLKPMYLIGSDFYKDNEGNIVDPMGGVCTALYTKDFKPFCYHTWFARNYLPKWYIDKAMENPNMSNEERAQFENWRKKSERIDKIFDWVKSKVQ